MEYFLTDYTSHIETFAYWEKGFSYNELDWLQEKARCNVVSARVGENQLNQNTRRSEISWLPFNSESSFVYQKLSHIVSALNSQFFRFDLRGFGETFQLTNYNEKDSGMYSWHVDSSFGYDKPCRKLSLVMHLSDPSEYEGGLLQIKVASDDPITIRKERGLIVVFPSWCLHQVTPVTKGTRQSLVSWITGPSFK